jgi:hypothetical protein
MNMSSIRMALGLVAVAVMLYWFRQGSTSTYVIASEETPLAEAARVVCRRVGPGAVARAAPSSNAAGADCTAEHASDERLGAILTAWGRVIHVVQAARLTALSVAVLAVFERWLRGALALSGGKTGLRGS